MFTIARNLSLEMQEIEVNKFKVDCFSNLREKINSSYPDPWLLWLSQDNTSMNFIYPCASDEGVKVETSLIIESTMTVRGYVHSKQVPLGLDYIQDVREIDTLLTELVKMITSTSSKICQPRLMIDEATALLQDAISCI